MDTPATGEGNNLATSAVIDPRTAIDPAALAALEHYKHPSKTNKVVVRFKAVGNVPIMRQNFYKITASNRFVALGAFLRKELGLKSSDPLFMYVNAAFSPAPDDIVGNLAKCFSTDGHLIVHYSSTAAYG